MVERTDDDAAIETKLLFAGVLHPSRLIPPSLVHFPLSPFLESFSTMIIIIIPNELYHLSVETNAENS